MLTTDQKKYPLDPLDPRGVLCFLALVVLWVVWASLPKQDVLALHVAARWAGYLALLAMLVPYVHIVERNLRSQPRWRMSFWLRLHIACSYAAFALLLVHCQARAGRWLTLALVVLTWTVMISGVVGFYGQKLLYSLLPAMKSVPREYGLERLEPERKSLLATARDRQKKLSAAPDVVRTFVQAAIDSYLASDYQFRIWPRRREASPLEKTRLSTRLVRFLAKMRRRETNPLGKTQELQENRYQQARLSAGPSHQEIVDEIWSLVEARRQLDHEYQLHQLGRLWLLFHGPAAWALLALVVEHVAVSFWYGGF